MNGSEGSLIRAIRGPVTLITVGVLFALNNFTPYTFDKTWPVILIVFGLLSLLRRSTEAPREAPAAGAPPYGFPPPGGYSRSPYAGQPAPPSPGTGTPPAGPAKGGFGASAPPRTGDPGAPQGGTL